MQAPERRSCATRWAQRGERLGVVTKDQTHARFSWSWPVLTAGGALVLLVVIVAAIPFVSDLGIRLEFASFPRHFDKGIWAQQPERREFMAQDLVASRRLLGIPKRDIASLLGSAQTRISSTDFGDQQLNRVDQLAFLGLPAGSAIPRTYDEYTLGPEPQFPQMDERVLVLTYDSAGRVQSAAVDTGLAWNK